MNPVTPTLDPAVRPFFFEPQKPADAEALADLLNSEKVTVIDLYHDQKDELLEIREPARLIDNGVEKKSASSREEGIWVYYPWRQTVVHTLTREEFYTVRTSRNHPIISFDEQEKLRKFRIGIAGLNVGNPGAVALAQEFAPSMKLADFDTLSLANLNRFRAGLPDLGLNKTVITARQITEIDPFIELELFPEGITPDTIEAFLQKPKIDLLIEEMDNLPMKIVIREQARALGIPVLMVTGNGEDIIIDVERFDLDSNLPLLSGYLKQEVIDTIKSFKGKPPTLSEKMSLARDFMGSEFLRPRLRDSFDLVGVSVAGIPQLAEATFLRGAALAYMTRLVATGADAPSGRYNLRQSDLVPTRQ